MSIYNTHQATQRHDKIYALLGMASDDISNAGLSPDYSVPWEQLQLRLLSFVLGDQISVKMWPGRDEVEIKGKGCVYGRVKTAKRSFNGGQDIYLWDDENDRARYEKSDQGWFIQATSADVREGDIVYFLEGASKPIIIRSFGAVFHVIALAAALTDQVQSELFPRQITLVWGWAKLSEISKSYVPSAPAAAKSHWNAALALTDTRKDASDEERARVLMTRLIELAARVEIKGDTAALAETDASYSISDMRDITPVEVLDLVRRFSSDIERSVTPNKYSLESQSITTTNCWPTCCVNTTTIAKWLQMRFLWQRSVPRNVRRKRYSCCLTTRVIRSSLQRGSSQQQPVETSVTKIQCSCCSATQMTTL
jgi:hypothetical protein